jgi:hypothetical protein
VIDKVIDRRTGLRLTIGGAGNRRWMGQSMSRNGFLKSRLYANSFTSRISGGFSVV